jgi:hypothetical protein
MSMIPEPRQFWLSRGGEPWREVTKTEYMQAEAEAGFHPKERGEIATAAFGHSRLELKGTTIRPRDECS